MTDKIISNTYEEIERLMPKLGTRLDLYMHTDNKCSPMQPFYNTSAITDRKMQYKIGKITDLNLLKKFKTNEDQAFKELYEYALNDKGLTQGSLTGMYKEADFNPANKITLEKDGYYYAYLKMDDENGKYYPIDDVAIYQENSGTCLVHFAFADMNFNSTELEDSTTSGTKYPNTGKIAIGIGIVVLIGATYVLYRKNNLYKDIK